MTREDSFALGQLIADTTTELGLFANTRRTIQERQELYAIIDRLLKGFKEIVKQSP